MKHIISYKIFDSILTPNPLEGKIKDISDNISDICLEISDNGYFILNNFLESGNYILIRKENASRFNGVEVLSTVIRIGDYLLGEGYYIDNINRNLTYKSDNISYEKFISETKPLSESIVFLTIYISKFS